MLRALGEHMFNRYVEIKRQEWEDYRVQVTQWELDRYLPVLVAPSSARDVEKTVVVARNRGVDFALYVRL